MEENKEQVSKDENASQQLNEREVSHKDLQDGGGEETVSQEDSKVLQDERIEDQETQSELDPEQEEKKRLEEAKKKRKKKRANVIFFTIISIVLVFTVTYSLLYTFCFVNIYVSGASMENTLNSGDYVVANKNKKANYGDIVVIEDASTSGSWIIKRVIAKGGDHVWIISQDANPDNIGVWLLKAEDIPDGTEYEQKKYYTTLSNYTKLDEPYAKGLTTPNNNKPNDRWDNIGENQIFYLGDNRQNSSDSRTYGCCTQEQIVGVVENWSLTLRPVRNLYYTAINWIAGLFGGSCVNDSN